MTSVSGVGPSSAASYASSIDSGLPANGRMDMATLQTWLGGQVGKMWDKVGEATKGVDDRNKLQAKLGEWTRTAENGGCVLASEVYKYAATLPDGAEKTAVLELVKANPSPEAIAGKEKELQGFIAQRDALASGKLTPGNPVGQALARYSADAAVTDASTELAAMRAPAAGGQALNPTNLAASCKSISTSLGKANDLAMNTLQAVMASAQQAMSLTSNLMKASDDSKSSVIRNMV